MARSSAANSQARALQRAKILSAARHVFARKGRAATMADIAAQAGISQGLAYRYFSGKEQILAEAAASSQTVAFEQFLVLSGSPVDRLKGLVEVLLGPDAPLEHQGLIPGPAEDKGRDDIMEPVRRQRRALHAVIRQLVMEGQRIGQIVQGNPDRLTLLLRACIDGIQRLALDELESSPGRLPTPDMVVGTIKVDERPSRHQAVPMPPSAAGDNL
jgi:AcrR family transcriptional regulator